MTKTLAPTLGRRIFVAVDSFTVSHDGVPHVFEAGITRVREGHPVLDGFEHLFRELAAHYEVESASAAPGEVRGG